MGRGGKRANAGRPRTYSDAEKRRYFQTFCAWLHRSNYEILKAISKAKQKSMNEIIETMIEEQGAAILDEKTLDIIEARNRLENIPY